MVSETPLDKPRIVSLLNKVLARSGLTALQDGRTLAILTIQDAERSRLTPVQVWNHDPASIPQDDQVATEIISLHSLNATQVVKDLAPMLPSDAQANANEGGNAIILTATQSDIRRFTQIIQALDNSGDSDLEVFGLHYADSKAIAQELKDVFTAQDAGANRGNPFQNLLVNTTRAAAGASVAAENPKRAVVRVNAVSDDQDNAVLVSAPMDIMPGISNLINKLDIPQDDMVEIRVFGLHHADPTDVAGEISSLFPEPSTQAGQQNNLAGTRPRFVSGPAATATADALSDRRKKQTTVIAVPDPRTQSVLVTASTATMAQIENLITGLDTNAAGEIQVYAFRPEHADVADLQNALADLFSSSTRSSTSTTLNPLALRASQWAQSGGTSSSSSSTPSVSVGGGSVGK
jgi:type II secretory pathway component GspD/PulD (secretin)